MHQPDVSGGMDAPPGDSAVDPLAHMGFAFHQFIDAYPAAHREPVGEAAQVWCKLSKDRRLPGLSRLLDGLDAWERSGQWQKDNGAFIPRAANFLRKTMWLGAPPPAPSADDDGRRIDAALERLKLAGASTTPVTIRGQA